MKKAQMQMMESIMAFIVLSIIVIFALVIYFNSQQNSIKEELAKVKSTNSLSVFYNVIGSYEFRCSDASQKNCLDYYKLSSFKSAVSSDENMKSYYVSKFGHSIITLNVDYPKQFNLTLFNATPLTYSSESTIFFPVVVFNETDGFYGSYYFGILKISVVS